MLFVFVIATMTTLIPCVLSAGTDGLRDMSVPDTSGAGWSGPIILELGPEETVFDYQVDRCAELDLPDVYAHAVRTPDGIVLASGNAPDNHFLFGPCFNTLERSCIPVFQSGDQWPVETFDHQEWITSLYSEDGVTIHALVHNEYHDPYAPNCKPGVTDPSNPCWYNFFSYAVSHDGGRSFTQPESPHHLVAIPPFQWNPDAVPGRVPPPHGYFEPSNIVFHNGHYYVIFFAITSNTNAAERGTCIMRTHDVSDPGSWLIWDGQDFSIPLVVPYPDEPEDPQALLPAFISNRTIRDLRGSLTWNTYLNQFMLIGASVFPVDGEETCGFFLSRSNDLINWSEPQMIRSTVFGWPPCERATPELAARNIRQEAYPSLIDHDAPDISFTKVGQNAFLYYMQNMDNFGPDGWGLRRNLVRIPIRFVIPSDDIYLSIHMPDRVFHPGEPFFADVRLVNLAQELSNAQLFVALSVGTGDFWFFPSWVQYPPELDWMDRTVPGNTDETISIIPEFIWPEGAGEFDGAVLYAALAHQGELVSNLADAIFGWAQ